MDIEVLADADAVARRGAEVVAEAARQAVAARGRFLLALSGGSTPGAMLRALADEDVPWAKVDVFQVDERIAPAGHGDRNLTRLAESLLGPGLLPAAQLHPMPVEAGDLEAAAARYAAALRRVAGGAPVLDLVHLGLGADGHTASLIAADPVLDVGSADVALAGPYQGRWRMTLTYPVLDRARRLLWLVTGSDKAAVLPRLRDGDRSIPAGRVCRDRALVLADSAASARLD